jgi:tetratricopeptide (TPR) repeat protein
MPKNTFILLIILCLTGIAKAQTANTVYDQYLDFNLKRLEGNTAESLTLGENILPNVDKLPSKAQINFYNGLAKLYEDDNQSVEAIPLYEKVAAAEPDFYVVHRALGYLYLKPADDLFAKLQSSPGNKEIEAAYKIAVLKALPHLEKAQACDPSDETLALIKSLYANIHDDANLRSLNARLKEVSKKCKDILSD